METTADIWDCPPDYASDRARNYDCYERHHMVSASNPTGAYEGKMWKRHDGSFDERFKARGGVPVWLLCWFGESQIGPGLVSNNYRKILLSDGQLLT
jgi:hypothetical protein